MDFGGIIGQREIIDSLERLLSDNRIGHAYIFSGPAGMGKKTIAHIFAGLLLCNEPHFGATCGKCVACVLFGKGSNPDFYRVSTEESSIGVDCIRDIQRDIAIKPVYSDRKVYIIEDAIKMTDQAQNCLLKIFEEPPRYAVIILLTVNYEALFETVRSRAQHFQLKKYSYEQVCQSLTDKFKRNDSLIRLAADYSDGNIGAALELVGSEDFFRLRDRTLSLLPGVAMGKAKDVLDFAAFMEGNKDGASLLLDIMLLYYRDLLVAYETGDKNMLINSDKRDIILNNARMYGSHRVVEDIEAIEYARRAIKKNANYQLVIDNLLIKLRGDR